MDREWRALSRTMSMAAVDPMNGWYLFVGIEASTSIRAPKQAVLALAARYRVIRFGRQGGSGGDSSLSTAPCVLVTRRGHGSRCNQLKV